VPRWAKGPVLASGSVAAGCFPRRALRASAVALAAACLAIFAPGASGQSTLEGLRERMDAIQDELDATTERIEELRTQADEARERIDSIGARIEVLRERQARLRERAGERADELYRSGGTQVLELLFSADDFSELSDRAEMLSAVSQQEAGVFVALARAELESEALAHALEQRTRALVDAREELARESERLQGQFDDVAAEYDELKARLAREQARREEVSTTSASAGSTTEALAVPSGGGMACPVAGAVSFVDSWGAPRDGHTHVGVDMMAAYGTPVVAITSGTITYAAYDGSGGNMIFLSGDDGNAYWYMHNQANLVSGGHVSAGQQIATVGDTGNAAGTPHLHFEYHPGGGAPVNPYPLVASLC
jgi:murein DD-endopeptidase MepM/ murein hydrolase activator NlpD